MAVVVHVVGEYDGKQLAKAQRDLNALKKSVGGASSAYAKAGGGVAGVAAQMDSAGGKIAGVGKKMTLGISLPLAAIGYSGIKTAADFQTTMASMQVNSGATGAKMEELRGLAMQLGADTVYSAGEAADAMLELSKGGMSTASIQGGALAATMNLAATEGMALGDAATIMTQSMNTFGIKAEDAAKVTDMLAAGAVASTAGVQDLADGMKYVGSTAASLHLPMADTVTALAAMNNAGIDSTTAGTSLNRMLLGLAAPSKNAGKAFEKFGVATTDANGQILDMQGMIAELKKKLGGLSDSDRNAALKQMFGVEGMRAANVLMKGGVKGWKDLSAAVNKAGVAQDLADARMSGIAGAIESMRGALETANLTLGDSLEPTVNRVTGAIKGLASWFVGLSERSRNTIAMAGVVAVALGPVAVVAGKVMQGFKVMVAPIGAAAKGLKAAHQGMSLARQGFRDAKVAQSAFSGPMGTLGGKLRTLTTAIGSGTKALATQTVAVAKAGAAWLVSTARQVAAKGAQLAVAAAAKVAAAGQWLLNAALTANPIGLVVAALIALGAGFLLLWKKSDKFRAGVTKVFAAIAVGVLGLVKVWLQGLKFMSGLFLNVVGVIVKGAAKAFGWVPGVGPKLKKAADGFEGFKKGVQTKLDKAIDKVGEWQTSVKNMPKKVELKGKIDDLKSKINDAKERLRDKGLTEPEKSKIRAEIKDLQDKVKAAKRELSGIKNKQVTITISARLRQANPAAWAKAERLTQGNFSITSSSVSSMATAAAGDMVALSSAAFTRLGSAVVSNLVRGLRDSKKKVRKAAQSVVNEINDAMDDARQRISDLKGEGRDLGRTLSRGLGDFGEGTKDFLTGMAESTTTADSMLADMRASVTSLNDWRGSLDRAAKKGLPNDIVEELRAMGLDSSDELRALNSMTDAQLKEWVGLWRQRDRSGAAEGAKQVADDIAKVVSSVEAKFESIGANAMKGLGKGLRSQSKTVRKRLQHLMDDIVADAKKALGIHSPSTVFAGIGSNVVLGMREGMANERAGLLKDVARIALPTTLPAATEPARAGTGTRSVVIAPGAVQVTVTGGPGGATPAEIRREVEAALKKLLREVMAS